MEFKISQNNQNQQSISEEKNHGPDLPGTGRGERIRPRSHMAAAPFKPASGARLSAAPGYRIGIGRFWPSD
jgi:hypothetical protein